MTDERHETPSERLSSADIKADGKNKHTMTIIGLTSEQVEQLKDACKEAGVNAGQYTVVGGPDIER